MELIKGRARSCSAYMVRQDTIREGRDTRMKIDLTTLLGKQKLALTSEESW